eukprot:659971-Pelagomonas_calceolata.AAC.1
MVVLGVARGGSKSHAKLCVRLCPGVPRGGGLGAPSEHAFARVPRVRGSLRQIKPRAAEKARQNFNDFTFITPVALTSHTASRAGWQSCSGQKLAAKAWERVLSLTA